MNIYINIYIYSIIQYNNNSILKIFKQSIQLILNLVNTLAIFSQMSKTL